MKVGVRVRVRVRVGLSVRVNIWVRVPAMVKHEGSSCRGGTGRHGARLAAVLSSSAHSAALLGSNAHSTSEHASPQRSPAAVGGARRPWRQQSAAVPAAW